MGKFVALYNAPVNSRIRVPSLNNVILNFKKIDGMYSICTNDQDEVIHLKATTEVEILVDSYSSCVEEE
jgi:hypothetical protein